MTHRVLKSHRSKMSVKYICSQKDRQCALPVIYVYIYIHSCREVVNFLKLFNDFFFIAVLLMFTFAFFHAYLTCFFLGVLPGCPYFNYNI